MANKSPLQFIHSKHVILLFTFVCITFTLGVQDAEAALLNQVNAAIREAGAPLTAERSAAFQKGVTTKHYTSYGQLVGAVKWHLLKGTLPLFAASSVTVTSGSASSVKVTVKQCVTGDVVSMSEYRVTITGDLNNSTVTKAMNITLSQYNNAVDQGVAHETHVKACTTDNFHSVSGDIENVS